MIKRIQILLILFFLATLSFAQKVNRIELSGIKGKTKNIESIQKNTNRIIIKEFISQIDLTEQNSKEGTFVKLTSEGMNKTFNPGLPDLPVFSKLIEIPLNYKVEIKVLSYDEEIISLNNKNINRQIIPAQPSVAKNQDPKDAPFHKNSMVYSSNAFFKKNIVSFDDRGYLRDKHLGYIEISPFEYNPVTNTIKVLNNIEVEVSFVSDNKAKKINTKNLKSPYFDNVVKTINQSIEPKEVISGPVKYVIVSDRMFEETIQPFIEWKTLKGFQVVVAYTDVIGTDKTSIKNYLQDLYDNPSDGISPTFVLFVGDVAQIPAYNGTTGSHYTDLYYCEYTGDKLPEVFYGRFSANNVTELKPQIDKTLEVEKYQIPDPSYLNNAVMIAGYDDQGNDLTFGNGFVNYVTQYYINTDNGFNPYAYYSPASKDLDADVRTKISEGVSIANYTAHCSENGWADPSFSVSNVSSMTNEHMYPLMIGNCCLSNKFDVTTCFGESLLRADQKGAVGYIGASDNSLWDEDYYWGVGVAAESANPTYESSGLGAYDRFFHLKGEDKKDWYLTQGQMIFAGNLAVESSTSSNKTYYWEIYHLMGDPSLTPFTGVPVSLTASYNSEIIVGSSVFNVTTEEDAYVAISKNGILFDSKLADATGVVELSFNPLDALGNLDLVITKQNKQPIIDEIKIVPPPTPYVVLNSFTIDDQLENDNGEADYGETINLDVELKNASNLYDAYLVDATLTTVDTNVTIDDNQENYGNILKSGSLLKNSAFTITLKNKFTDQQIVPFILTITGKDSENNLYTWTSKLNIKVNAPELEILDFITDDHAGNANDVLDIGETADILLVIANNGRASISGLESSLSLLGSTSSFITLNSAIVNNFSIEAQDIDTISFNLTASAAAENGDIAYLSFNVDDLVDNVYSVSKDNKLIIGEVQDVLISQHGTVLTNYSHFYDSGGKNNNYGNNQSDTITFVPVHAGEFLFVEFLSLAIEPKDDGCWDVLSVYDGKNTNAPLIGEYCSSNIPTIIKATNTDGALTFKFVSDESVTDYGWDAIVRTYLGHDYQLTVNSGAMPVEGAYVEFNGESLITGADGIVLFENVPEDIDIPLSVEAGGYVTYNSTVDLLEDRQDIINLNEDLYDITFNIYNKVTGAPLENAKIDFLGQTVYTNSSGKYIFIDNEYKLNVKYIISKEGFNDEVDSIDINKDKSITISMDSVSYDITFIIVDANNHPIENVNVNFDSKSLNSSNYGIVVFSNIPSQKGLIYKLTKTGYRDVEDTLDVEDHDIRVNITMQSITGIKTLENNEIKVYPNPSNGIFNLEINNTGSDEFMVKVFDVLGSVIYNNRFSGNQNIKELIDISKYAKGLYFLSIESNKNTVISRRIIIK